MVFDDINDLGLVIHAWGWSWVGVSGFFLSLRLYTKHLIHRGFSGDDWALLGAWTAIAVAQTLASCIVRYGLGIHKANWDFETNHEPLLLTINFIFTLTLSGLIWSKTSFAITLLRLTSGHARTFVWFALVSTQVVLGVMILLLWVKCVPVMKIWHPEDEGQCLNPQATMFYAVAAAAWSGIMDLSLALFSWRLLKDLPMKHRERLAVGFAMSLGVMSVVSPTGPTWGRVTFSPVLTGLAVPAGSQ